MKREQKELDKWFLKKGWNYWTPHEILARLAEEVGELARLINHYYGPKKKKPEENPQDLKEEIGDILYTLACLANSHKIDLDDCVRISMKKVIKRDKNRF